MTIFERRSDLGELEDAKGEVGRHKDAHAEHRSRAEELEALLKSHSQQHNTHRTRAAELEELLNATNIEKESFSKQLERHRREKEELYDQLVKLQNESAQHGTNWVSLHNIHLACLQSESAHLKIVSESQNKIMAPA